MQADARVKRIYKIFSYPISLLDTNKSKDEHLNLAEEMIETIFKTQIRFICILVVSDVFKLHNRVDLITCPWPDEFVINEWNNYISDVFLSPSHTVAICIHSDQNYDLKAVR